MDKKLIAFFKGFEKPYKRSIYHYTSVDGIIGIITKHKIWMSDTAFTNDTTELNMFQNLDGTKFQNEHVRRAFEKIKEGKDKADYFMASFSKRMDLLEQWRAYGNYCIEFDAQKLNAVGSSLLCDCIYNENQIYKWINESSPKISSFSNNDPFPIAAILVKVGYMKYKNHHFKGEREVRIITRILSDNKRKVRFRAHKNYGFPLPYIEFCVGDESCIEDNSLPLPIKNVFIRPMPHQDEAKKACEKLLKQNGYNNVEVQISKDIPYRGI